MARKVKRVHYDKDPEMLSEILSTYLELKAELDSDMKKESGSGSEQ